MHSSLEIIKSPSPGPASRHRFERFGKNANKSAKKKKNVHYAQSGAKGNKRVKDQKWGLTQSCSSMVCPFCKGQAKLKTWKEVYGAEGDERKRFWVCDPCDARVGCHLPADENGRGGLGDGTVPLGTMANRPLRGMRLKAHGAFDQMWRGLGWSRTRAYHWLASEMRKPISTAHIAMFNEKECEQVILLSKT